MAFYYILVSLTQSVCTCDFYADDQSFHPATDLQLTFTFLLIVITIFP